jgi:hypothetical protein
MMCLPPAELAALQQPLRLRPAAALLSSLCQSASHCGVRRAVQVTAHYDYESGAKLLFSFMLGLHTPWLMQHAAAAQMP